MSAPTGGSTLSRRSSIFSLSRMRESPRGRPWLLSRTSLESCRAGSVSLPLRRVTVLRNSWGRPAERGCGMIRSRPGWSSGGERALVLVQFEQVVGRVDQPLLGPRRGSPAQSRAPATSLGKGRATDDGCLQCPWHAALYDVATGAMVRGPQGAFKPLAGAVKATTGRPSAEGIPGGGAGRRNLVGRLSDGSTPPALRSAGVQDHLDGV